MLLCNPIEDGIQPGSWQRHLHLAPHTCLAPINFYPARPVKRLPNEMCNLFHQGAAGLTGMEFRFADPPMVGFHRGFAEDELSEFNRGADCGYFLNGNIERTSPSPTNTTIEHFNLPIDTWNIGDAAY
jgi:hypothetical protein